MKTTDEQTGRRPASDILFSRTVKAGKRVYYIDVKRDRNGENYLSVTESKRVRDSDGMAPPVFEKHKIFLYHEDLERFVAAFGETVDYIRNSAPADDAPHEAAEETTAELAAGDFDIEF